MPTNAPNLTPGHRYCASDDCFNIIPDNGDDELCAGCAPTPASLADQSPMSARPVSGPTYTDLAREVDQLRELVRTLNRRDSEIRQQAFLDLATELAEMEPKQRDAAIRRIIDRAQ